jgi:hypothetical protein
MSAETHGPSAALDRATAVATIRGWANQIAMRYSAPVWLVGSSLDVEDLRAARDFDIRVVLKDAEFEARFGVEPTRFMREQWSSWSDGSKRWGAEMAKLSRGWMTQFAALKLNLDFQVHPFYVGRIFYDRPRVRLDELDLIREADGS